MVATRTSNGVLRGTRLTTMDAHTGGDIYLYYQYEDGGLHYIPLSSARIWQGSTDLRVTDAMLGTPLAATSTRFKGAITVGLPPFFRN